MHKPFALDAKNALFCLAVCALALLKINTAQASKWTGPQFVVTQVKVTALKPCPQENIRVDSTEWVIDHGPDCVMAEARPQEVLELISAWNKDQAPYAQGTYYFTAKKGSIAKRQKLRVLLRPGPRYDDKLVIVGQKIQTRIVEPDTEFWYSELNALTAQADERVRLELRFTRRQVGRLAANPQHGYSLLLDLKKSCVSAENAKHIDLKDCSSYADFRHFTRARNFQTNKVSGTLEMPNLHISSGFGFFSGELELQADGNPELENSVGKEAAHFHVLENGDIEELAQKSAQPAH